MRYIPTHLYILRFYLKNMQSNIAGIILVLDQSNKQSGQAVMIHSKVRESLCWLVVLIVCIHSLEVLCFLSKGFLWIVILCDTNNLFAASSRNIIYKIYWRGVVVVNHSNSHIILRTSGLFGIIVTKAKCKKRSVF